jgi:hypothetical protein
MSERLFRVPIWPGVQLTFGGEPNPAAVRVEFRPPYDKQEHRTVRLVSKRGWMLLLVRYDWRKL